MGFAAFGRSVPSAVRDRLEQHFALHPRRSPPSAQLLTFGLDNRLVRIWESTWSGNEGSLAGRSWIREEERGEHLGNEQDG